MLVYGRPGISLVKMAESKIKILDTYFLPKRISFGLSLTAALLVSPCFFEGRYLNPLTISLHICNYIYWASTIFLLHRDARNLIPSYPFGQVESVVGAMIPFSYIFWNFHWVSHMWERLEMGSYSFKYNQYFVGSLAALASVLCFPDNLDKLPSVVPFFAFIVLYSITWLLTLRINKLSSEVHI